MALKKCYEKEYCPEVMEKASDRMYEAYNYLDISKKYIHFFSEILQRE